MTVMEIAVILLATDMALLLGLVAYQFFLSR